MKKISANPDRLLLRAQNSTTRLGFQLDTLAKVLVSFETLIEQGDQRLLKRDVPEDLNSSGRLLWVTNELDELSSKLQGLRQHTRVLINRLDLISSPQTVTTPSETPGERTWHTQQVYQSPQGATPLQVPPGDKP